MGGAPEVCVVVSVVVVWVCVAKDVVTDVRLVQGIVRVVWREVVSDVERTQFEFEFELRTNDVSVMVDVLATVMVWTLVVEV